jgi:hypothetical protein
MIKVHMVTTIITCAWPPIIVLYKFDSERVKGRRRESLRLKGCSPLLHHYTYKHMNYCSLTCCEVETRVRRDRRLTVNYTWCPADIVPIINTLWHTRLTIKTKRNAISPTGLFGVNISFHFFFVFPHNTMKSYTN